MRSCALIGIIPLLFGVEVHAQNWGSVKAQIVWGDSAVPDREKITVMKDQGHCSGNGPLLSEVLLIEPKSKGIKNVLVWLKSTDDSPLSIHPDLKKVPTADVEIDQPLCQFNPRVVALREGQSLVVKNSAPVAHSAKLDGRVNALNQLIPPGGSLRLSGEKSLKTEPKPIPLSCALHGWMSGLIGVFDHPYFAVSNDRGIIEIKNAPAGECAILMFHEKFGWMHLGKRSSGQRIKIPANDTVDLGFVKP